MRYCIDTNHVSMALHQREMVLQRLERLSRIELCITAVTLAELEWSTVNHPGSDSGARRWDQCWRRLVRTWPVLSFSKDEAPEHARLRAELRTHPIGERDLMIAAIARANDLVMVTANTGEFQRVRGLKVEDWSR